MEILLLVGLTIFLATLNAKFFQQIRIPQVTGFIVVGLVMGQSGFNIWTPELIQSFGPLIDLALGLIGFMIGSELRFDLFKNRGRSIYPILFTESLMAYFLVGVAITMMTGKLYYGILFGALATATAPAATVDVFWENKARGPLTSTVLAVVALDDIVALLIYAFSAMFARNLIVHEAYSFTHIIDAVGEIGIGFAIGIISGLVMVWLIHFIKEKERILPFSLGVIALQVGIASHFHIDLILSSMLVGLTLVNVAPVESGEIFSRVKRFSMPVNVLFFALVGAKMNLRLFSDQWIVILAVVYVISRSVGKVTGAYLGGVIGKAEATVKRYTGLCLFSQAGVAIGLAISIQNNLSHVSGETAQIGQTIINVIVATTFIVQVIGPKCTEYAIRKSGERGRDITEQDIIDSFRVQDLIEEDVPIIREDVHFNEIIERVKSSESYDFCVVDHKNRFLGMISIGDLRGALLEGRLEVNDLILAKDILVPYPWVIESSKPLEEALKLMRRKNLDYLPAVRDTKNKELMGLIHYRYVISEVHKELLNRRGIPDGAVPEHALQQPGAE